jgi:hypothetical protein
MELDLKKLDLDTFWGKTLDYLFNRGLLYAIVSVTLYVLLGTLFYAYYDDFGLVGGFNYAVSLAFTIGWKTELSEKDDWSYIFSSIYIFGGILMISGVLIYVSHLISIHSIKWYEQRAIHQRRSRRLSDLDLNERISFRGYWIMLKVFYNENTSAILAWVALLLYVILGVMVTSLHEDVDVIEGIYYVMSTISTTGSYIPFNEDADNKYFMLTSLYAIGGVLFGSTAMVYLGDVMVKALMYERLDRHIDKVVTSEELDALKEIGITEAGKPITKKEYLIMMAIRMELIDENFISYVFEKYKNRSDHLITSDSVRDVMAAMTESERSSEHSKLLP